MDLLVIIRLFITSLYNKKILIYLPFIFFSETFFESANNEDTLLLFINNLNIIRISIQKTHIIFRRLFILFYFRI